jgi:hypothetical protein
LAPSTITSPVSWSIRSPVSVSWIRPELAGVGGAQDGLFFHKPDKLTVSGVDRRTQRKIYDQRRDTEIPAHGLKLVIIKPADLDAAARGRLRRNPEADQEAVTALLDAAGLRSAAREGRRRP